MAMSVWLTDDDEPPNSLLYFVFSCFFLELHKTMTKACCHLVVFFPWVAKDDNGPLLWSIH